MPVLPTLPPTIRLLTNPELERLRARFPNVSMDPRKCPTCRGRGTFSWLDYSISPPSQVTYDCNCGDQWTLNLYFLNSNIGDVYQRISWHDVRVESGALEKVEKYLDHSEAYINAGCGLVLFGRMGTGKTLLSILVLKALLAEGYDGYFTTFSEMIDTYTGGWHDAEEKEWFHRRIKNAEILVMDDVGKEHQGRTKSGLPEATFDEVLRHRVAAGTPTIITTNYTLNETLGKYGAGIMSLLHERATTYEFTGKDFREGLQKSRVDAEIDRGLTRPIVIG